MPEDLPSLVEIYNFAVLAKSSTCDLVPVRVASRKTWFDDSLPERHPIWGGYLLREAISHAPKLGARTWGRLPGVADLDGVIPDVVFVGLTFQPIGHATLAKHSMKPI